MTKTIREVWSSKLGFILATVGSAIGLGAMWKLPYTIGQNGGGAFILLFVIFNFLIGLPLFIGELLLGRESRKGVVSAFVTFSEKGSTWALIGWLTALSSLLILGWYCVVAGWGICYVFLSLTDAFSGLSREEIGQSFDLFRQSGNLNAAFQLIFIGLNASILLKGLSQGIEKWSKLLTSSLFIFLFLLAIYSLQLSGFAEAAHYLLYPDFSKLTGKGALQALGLALFTLSLAYGAVLTYGSYLKKDEDLPKIATYVVLANILASILIAITIFPMIFTFGFAPEEGEGLIFKTLPYVFKQLPGSTVIALIFFILLFFAALTSSLAMFEVVVANFVDLGMMSRRMSVFVASLLAFVLGMPVAFSGSSGIFPSWHKIFGTSYMETSNLLIDWLLVIIAFFTTIFIGYRMAFQIRSSGFLSGTKAGFLYGPWLALIRTLVPIAILLVIGQHAHLIQW